MAAGQEINKRLSNGGYEFTLENNGPATTATLRVQAGPGAPPVMVGSIHIDPGMNGPFAFEAPKTTLSFTGTAGNAAGT